MSARSSAGPAGWTHPADIVARVRRAWARGDLLRAHAQGSAFTPIEMPLRAPSGAELSEHLEEARRWAAEIERASDGGRSFDIISGVVGGKHLGRSTIPVRVRLDREAQAWRLLGVAGDVERFDELLQLSANALAAREWVLAQPLKAIELFDEWPAMLAALDWLDWHRDSQLYLRQVDAPGVDTKFIERHRAVLAKMLGVPGGAEAFRTALGFAGKPCLARLRFDPSALGLPPAITEATLRIDELASMRKTVSRLLIVENEITFLSAPVPERSIVLWGRGYEAGSPAALELFTDVSERGDAYYWGDLDTHGFEILSRVRSHLPRVRSVLMDRETLLAHEQRWVTEPSPTNRALPGLTDTETELYSDLVTDRLGHAVRLEQERIDWAWASRRLAAVGLVG
ncbi:Wadjet anti-phage system protein JetD domain-containing protein [Leucobacter celer]|uniref:Wadjet anti-phage system protein JetD domain-containing protein n=1 Tax=Leucobacter celer TaxID=668625 RepID=UPI0006A758C1|nr:Wadjet anti-phage system protein JetD domain-containing protein [Leucobacter celer]